MFVPVLFMCNCVCVCFDSMIWAFYGGFLIFMQGLLWSGLLCVFSYKTLSGFDLRFWMVLD